MTLDIPSPCRVNLSTPKDIHRKGLETFIQHVFCASYSANIGECMPVLMGLYDTVNTLQAALGLRFAGSDRLFLETYLNEPVDTLLATRLGRYGELYGPRRDVIVEVGNLAATQAGGTRWLIIALTALLQGAGFEWAVFTATRSLRNAFNRLGLYMHPLGAADPIRLTKNTSELWGSYYSHDPHVVAVNVQHTFGVLDRYLRNGHGRGSLSGIWRQSYDIGNELYLPNSQNAANTWQR